MFLDNFYCAFSSEEQNRLLLQRPMRCMDIICTTGIRGRAASTLARMLYADQKTYLVELLMKQDQMSMACFHREPRAVSGSYVRGIRHRAFRIISRSAEARKSTFSRRPWRICCRTTSFIARRWVSPRRCEVGCWIRARRRSMQPSDRRKGCWLRCWICEEVSALIDRHRAGFEDATDRIWRLLNLQLWGDMFLTGRKIAWPAAIRCPAVGNPACMKILWVKSDFLHPTTKGGHIRTLETLKRLHRRHEIHYVALDLAEQAGGVQRCGEYCTKCVSDSAFGAGARIASSLECRWRATCSPSCRWR